MSNERKPYTDELYAQRQWSDNLSFSNKAMDESKKKTGHLPEEPPAPAAANKAGAAYKKSQEPVRMSKKTARASQLDQYVNDMGKEVHRVSNAVNQRMDRAGSKFSESMKQIVKPLSNTVNEVAETAAESIKLMGTGIGKVMLQEMTSVIRNIGDKVAVNTPHVEGVTPVEEVVEDPTPALPSVRTFKTHFGTLLEGKVFFSTIHSRPFLTERDIEVYQPGHEQQAFEWMTRGLDEIRNCAPYGQKLPTPKKGPYMNIPMYDILREITYDDLEKFLLFVSNRPLPFQQKPLKLSEAFATWVHKGAPEQ